MKKNFLKIAIIGVSLALFFLSLTQDAFVTFYNGSKHLHSGLECFLMGSTAILGGGLLEWIIWITNPLSLFSIIYLTKNNRIAIKTGIAALLLAASFRLWSEVLGSESGSMAKIMSFKAGYYLWLTSIIILNIGTIYYFII